MFTPAPLPWNLTDPTDNGVPFVHEDVTWLLLAEKDIVDGCDGVIVPSDLANPDPAGWGDNVVTFWDVVVSPSCKIP